MINHIGLKRRILFLISLLLISLLLLSIFPKTSEANCHPPPSWTKLKVATWNVEGLESGYNLSFIITEIDLIDPDIIGLNEVTTGQAFMIALILNREYKIYTHGQSTGNAILVKKDYKIVGSNHWDLKDDSDDGFKRSLLQARVRTDKNTLVDFYVTHLANGRDSIDIFDRKKQVEKIKEIISKSSHPNTPVVIVGDFNARAQPIYDELGPMEYETGTVEQIMLGVHEKLYFDAGRELNEFTVPSKGDGEKIRIDYIFISDDIDIETYGRTFGHDPFGGHPDHRGVYTTVNVPGKVPDPNPGCDHPDDNHSVASTRIQRDSAKYARLAVKKNKPSIIYSDQLNDKVIEFYNLPPETPQDIIDSKWSELVNHVDLLGDPNEFEADYQSIPDVAILANGYAGELASLVEKFNEPVKLVDINFDPNELKDQPLFLIPSGGLYGLDSSPIFKAKLEEYVNNGGTLVSFSQQHGYEYQALPGGQLAGYGWLEDQSCWIRSVNITDYQPIFAGQNKEEPDIHVDGYFTNFPSSTSSLLTRTQNGMPAMLTYPFGEGRVIASTLFSDWSYGMNQASEDEKALVRDLISWAKAKTNELPEVRPGESINTKVVIKNIMDSTATSAVLNVLSPNKEPIKSTTIPLTLPPGTSQTVPFGYLTSSARGIFYIDYILKDIDGNIIQPQAEGKLFAVSEPPLWTEPSNQLLFSIQSNAEEYLIGQEARFTFNFWNNGEITETITAWYSFPHNFWQTGDSIYGEPGTTRPGNNSNLKTTIEVPAHGFNSFTYMVPVFASSDRLWADFYDDDNNYLGRSTRGIYAHYSSVEVDLNTDKQLYLSSETVTVKLNLIDRNLIDYQAVVKLGIYDNKNERLINREIDIELSNSGSASETLAFSLPENVDFGTYQVRAEVYKDSRLIGLDSDSFEIPELHIRATPILPASLIPNSLNNVAIKLENTGYTSVKNGSIFLELIDPDNSIVSTTTSDFYLNIDESITINFDVELTDIIFGDYLLKYTLDGDGKSTSDELYLPNEISIDGVFDKTDYKVRDQMNFDLAIENSGKFSLESLVEIRIPDLSFEDSTTVNLNPGEKTQYLLSLLLPSHLSPGEHSIDVTTNLNSSKATKTFTFFIPEPKLKVDIASSDYSSGDTMIINLENLGGTDTSYSVELRLSDSRDFKILEQTIVGTIQAEQIKNIDFIIPESAVTGTYRLFGNYEINNSATMRTFSKNINIQGIQSSLNIKTDKNTYLANESPAGISQIFNQGIQINNGLLNLTITGESVFTGERQINSNESYLNAEQVLSAISGDKIIWRDNRNGNYDIYMYDLATETERQITNDFEDQRDPAISGDKIVWTDRRNGNYDIYMYDLATETERQITTDSISQYDPAISGDKIVWRDRRNGNNDIYMYDLATETERQITTDSRNQSNPAISGDKIIWRDSRNGNMDIYMYDLATETERQITTDSRNQSDPAISGDKIVWTDTRNGKSDIYMYDLATETERQITADLISQYYPAISGDKIVWTDNRNQNNDIYMYDLTTETERQVNSNERKIAQQYSPAISGDKIVWSDNRNGNMDIYMYDLATETERQITTDSGQQYNPAISGDKIVWTDTRNDNRNSNYDIYMYDLATETERQITTNLKRQWDPAISGDKIVWEDHRNQYYDIYMYDLDTETERQITTESQYQSEPAISGDKIVWEDSGSWCCDIVMYDLATETKRQITTDSPWQAVGAAISGDKIIWLDDRNGNYDIFMYELATETERQITTNLPAQAVWGAAISGDKIVWSDNRNGNREIYLYDLATETELQITTNFEYQDEPAISGDKIVWSDYRNGSGDIYMYGETDGEVFWKKELPLSLAASETIEITEVINQFDATGKFYLSATLKSALEQTIAEDSYSFYVFPSSSALIVETDKKTYKPNESINLSGSITNNADLPLLNQQVSVIAGSDVIYTENILQLDPGDSYYFSSTFSALESFTLKSTFDDVTIEEDIDVIQPDIAMTVDAPSVVSGEEFDINITLQNIVEIDANLVLDVSGATETVPLLAQQSKMISKSFRIDKDSTITVTLSGDVNQLVQKNILFGENTSITLSPDDRYLEGEEIRIPYEVENTGLLETSFDLEFTFGDQTIIKPLFLPVGSSYLDEIKLGLLNEGDYKLIAKTPFDSSEANFSVVKKDQIELNTNISEPANNILDVNVDAENIGFNDFSGTLILETPFDKREQEVDLALGDIDQYEYSLYLLTAEPGLHELKLSLLNGSGHLVNESTTTFEIEPPLFEVTQAPNGLAVDPGKVTTMTFEIQNNGDLTGEALFNLDVSGINSFQRSVWLYPDQSEEISFNVLIPDDLEEKDYKANYSINDGVLNEFVYHINGINIDVSAYLDKEVYMPSDIILLNLNVTRLAGASNVNLFAKASIDGVETTITLTSANQQTVILELPYSDVFERIAYGIYHQSGRAIYLNTTYFRRVGDVITLTPDKALYLAGEAVTVDVDTFTNDILNVEFLGTMQSLEIIGPTSFNFNIPSEIRSGTYYINYSFDEIAGEIPIDIKGYSAKIVDARLDKSTYQPNDIMKASFVIDTQNEFDGIMEGYIYDHSGASSKAFKVEKAFSPGENAFDATSSIEIDSPGLFSLHYELRKKDSNIYLAGGRESFDIKGASLVSLSTDKPSYPSSVNEVIANISAFGDENAVLRLFIDDVPVLEEAVAISGYTDLSYPVTGLSPGYHTLKAELVNGLTSEMETEFVFGNDLSDLTLTSEDISFGINSDYESSTPYLQAAISNVSKNEAENVVTRFYNGDPQDGGVMIGEGSVEIVPARGRAKIQIPLNNGSLNSEYNIFVQIDPNDEILEFNELNNFSKRIMQIDTHPPETTAIITPSQPDGNNGWYTSSVEVTLLATDTLSGIFITEYSLNEGITWNLYDGLPIFVTDEGINPISFRSIDRDGNIEDKKSTIIKIDGSSPEASIYFGETSRDIMVIGLDNVEGTVTVSWTEESGSIITGSHGWKIRKYLLADDAGNSTELIIRIMAEGNAIYAGVESIAYDSEDKINLSDNDLKFEWAVNKSMTLMMLNQRIEVQDKFIIKAIYVAIKDQTDIKIKKIDDVEQEIILSGMNLIRLVTSDGELNYKIQ